MKQKKKDHEKKKKMYHVLLDLVYPIVNSVNSVATLGNHRPPPPSR